MKKLAVVLLLVTFLAVNYSDNALACETQNNDQEMECYNLAMFEAQKIESPNIMIPNIEIPDFEIPNIILPVIEIPNIEIPYIEIPNIEMPNIGIPNIEPTEFISELFKNGVESAMNSANIYNGYVGIYDFRYIEVNDNHNNKEDANYVIPVTGDIININYDEQTGITETNVISQRNDNPSLKTISYPDDTVEATITADGDNLIGNDGNINWGIIVGDNKSNIHILLKNSSYVAYTINEDNKAKSISLSIDATSQWVVTGTSYIDELVIEDNNISHITSNGNTIYYDAKNSTNNWLGGKTIELSDGGKLVPFN